jgi:anti-anti-sigma factor
MSARLIVRDDGDVVVIEAFGKLASGNGCHSLHAQIKQLAGNGHCRILVNVSGVPCLDSADIGELLAGYASVVMAGGELKLLNPRDKVESVLRTTRISKLLGIYVDELSAFRSFSGMPHSVQRIAAGSEPRSEWYIG